jgi:hypothetical protein
MHPAAMFPALWASLALAVGDTAFTHTAQMAAAPSAEEHKQSQGSSARKTIIDCLDRKAKVLFKQSAKARQDDPAGV